jgi:hypothetical protein
VASAEPTSPDHDSLEQGDQTGPDNSAAVAATGTSSPQAAPSGEESGAKNESSAPSDGPGGHADPSGDVQHEFTGVE